MARFSKVQPVVGHRRLAQTPQDTPVRPGQNGLAGEPQPDRDQHQRQRNARHPGQGDAGPELIVQDDRGSGQDQHLGDGERYVAPQLESPAHQADGGLVKYQGYRSYCHPGRE